MLATAPQLGSPKSTVSLPDVTRTPREDASPSQCGSPMGPTDWSQCLTRTGVHHWPSPDTGPRQQHTLMSGTELPPGPSHVRKCLQEPALLLSQREGTTAMPVTGFPSKVPRSRPLCILGTIFLLRAFISQGSLRVSAVRRGGEIKSLGIRVTILPGI